jgi:aromatic ring-opening dioxygenase LigB subunit
MGSFFRPDLASADVRHDTYFDGVDHFENMDGGNIRVICYVNRIVDGKRTRVILDHGLVMPASAFPDAIGKALMQLARQVVVSPNGTLSISH